MRALLIDASELDDRLTREAADAMEASLTQGGAAVERVVAGDLSVRPCTGCFGCWVKSPGQCVIADDARWIAEKAIAADIVAVVSPVAWGSYGSRAKSVIDRLICLVLPHFTFVDGEVHHQPRYPRYPEWLALGTLREHDVAQEALFARLVERNAVNLHSPRHAVEVVAAGEEARDAAERLARAVEIGEKVLA